MVPIRILDPLQAASSRCQPPFPPFQAQLSKSSEGRAILLVTWKMMMLSGGRSGSFPCLSLSLLTTIPTEVLRLPPDNGRYSFLDERKTDGIHSRSRPGTTEVRMQILSDESSG